MQPTTIEYVINPKTNKRIQRNGATHLKLLAAGCQAHDFKPVADAAPKKSAAMVPEAVNQWYSYSHGAEQLQNGSKMPVIRKPKRAGAPVACEAASFQPQHFDWKTLTSNNIFAEARGAGANTFSPAPTPVASAAPTAVASAFVSTPMYAAATPLFASAPPPPTLVMAHRPLAVAGMFFPPTTLDTDVEMKTD